MKLRLDHIAVAVADLEGALEDFRDRLGLECNKIESVPSEGAQVAFFDLGGPHLELVAAAKEDSAIGRSIAKRGEGLHHICLEVPDLDAALSELKARGVRLVNSEPTPGAGGTRVAFIHPSALRGVLVELVENKDPAC